MKIIANSKNFETPENTSVADFIKRLGLNPERCVVELNGEAMRYSQFREVVLAEGDKLEVMKVVAGG